MRRAALIPATPAIALGMLVGSLMGTTAAVTTAVLDDSPAFAQGKGAASCQQAVVNPNPAGHQACAPGGSP
jgi:xanthosine utilization system XapX-like protein